MYVLKAEDILKTTTIIILALFGLYLAAMFALSAYSRFVEGHAENNGLLRPCPDSPNCICSEDYPNKNVEALSFEGIKADQAWMALQTTIKECGGTIRKLDTGYIWATFTTSFFRFIDDAEFRLESEKELIQIRSASRVGYSDFGANQRRYEQLRAAFASNIRNLK